MTLRPFNKLPGPWGLPFIGSLLDLSKEREKVLHKWAEENYGPVFRLRLGSKPYLTLQGYEAIKEALIDKAESFSGRIDAVVVTKLRSEKGVFFTDVGSVWNYWHEFSYKNLQAIWETSLKAIRKEAEELEKCLSSSLETPLDLQDSLVVSTTNSLLQTVFSMRYDANDSKVQELNDLIYTSIFDRQFSFSYMLSIMNYFPSYKRYFAKVTDERNQRIAFLQKLLDERLADDDRSSCDDLASCYKQCCQASQDEDEAAVTSSEYFLTLVGDFLFAGITTTTNQLLWAVLFVLKHPQCMEKIQKELATVCEGEFDIEKSEQLHYTNAVVQESLRMRPIAPMSSIHKTNKATSVMGYEVPKDTGVLMNIWSVHMDKKVWGPDPEVFRPERHLDEEGKFSKSDHVIAFSIGWRRCVGQKLAFTQILTYLSTLFLKFNMGLADESKNVDLNREKPAGILKTKPFKVVLHPRNCNGPKESMQKPDDPEQ